MGWMRHPRTTQERRANGKRSDVRRWIMEETELLDCHYIKIRPCRNMSNLIHTYDDPWRYTTDRSWKKFRKTQYKAAKR